ncbi:hypothetical protein Csa_013504 [Cucumis sativus]|nr:hypothetical protein Csa_013504 [Cucumis sativus]
MATSAVIFLPSLTRTRRRFPANANSTNTVIHATIVALAAINATTATANNPRIGSHRPIKLSELKTRKHKPESRTKMAEVAVAVVGVNMIVVVLIREECEQSTEC